MERHGGEKEGKNKKTRAEEEGERGRTISVRSVEVRQCEWD